MDSGLTFELTHAGTRAADREAELSAPSGVVCSDFVSRPVHVILRQLNAKARFWKARQLC
jgi:hypothetical protein